MTDYNPKHYRYPRTYRDSSGGEHLTRLPLRIRFRHRTWPRLSHVLLALFLVALVAILWRVTQ